MRDALDIDIANIKAKIMSTRSQQWKRTQQNKDEEVRTRR